MSIVVWAIPRRVEFSIFIRNTGLGSRRRVVMKRKSFVVKGTWVVSLLVFMCAGSVMAQDYHYGFVYPREKSVGTLSDGDLDFINDPVFVPSLIGIATNEPVGSDWALRLERDQQQYAKTTSLGQSTVFDGSYRVEAFFSSDGLSDSAGGTEGSRQGIVYITDPLWGSMMLMVATYRDGGAGPVRLMIEYLNYYGSFVDVYGTTELNLDQWYHVEVQVDNQGDNSLANDEILVYLNGVEEIHVQGVALAYLYQLHELSIGYGASASRTFQGTIDEVVVSSSLGESSLLQTLPNATSVVTRISGMGIQAYPPTNVLVSYTAPFGGEHGLYFKEDLSLTNWVYKGELAVDDLDWFGEWFDTATNYAGFYMVESTRTTKTYDPLAPATIEDILETGSPYFDPWDTTRWADWYDGSGRLIKPFELTSNIVFDGPGHVWSPDVSVLPDQSGIFELEGDQPLSIEGNGLVLDIRIPELAGKSISQIYDLSYSEAQAIIPYYVHGVYFNQLSGDPVSTTISDMTFRGFDKAIVCDHFNQMAGVITNCLFEYNEWAFFPRGTPSFLVVDSTIHCNLLGGVYAEYNSANWIFRGNTFLNNNPTGAQSYGDLVLDACHDHLIESNQFLGTTEPAKVPDSFRAISLFRNRGEADDIREYASSRHMVRGNVISGYNIGIDVAVRTGRSSGNDKSNETRTYAYNNTFADNTFSNCVIGFHLVGNRNTLAGNSYVNVEREVTIHSPFYKNEGTLLDGEDGTEVWLWGDDSDYTAYADYMYYQGNADRYVAQSNRLFFVSSVNGTPSFHDTADGKIFVHEQSLLDGNSMQSVFNNGGVIRDIAVADIDMGSPGMEFAVIWNQPVSRIDYTDYYSIIIYDQSGKEIDRCGRSTMQWDAIAAGNFISGLGWIHIDEEAEVAAVHSSAVGGTYPVYIFRRGWAAEAVQMQSAASTPATDIAAERMAGSGYASLAVARGANVSLLTPSTASESSFCTLSATPLAIQLGEFDGNHVDGNELAALNGGSVAFYESGSSASFLTGAAGAWSSFTAGEFNSNTNDGDELAIASATAVGGLYPVEYFDSMLTNAFKIQSHSVLSEQTRSMASGEFIHGLGPDGYFRYGDGRASFCYEFQPRFELENTGFSSGGDLVASASSIEFAASPFDFDGDGSVEDEQAVHLSYADNEYFQLDNSTGFTALGGFYTVEAFFNSDSLPDEEPLQADTRRGIFYWNSTHINGTMYLSRVGGELQLEALVRKGGETFATANVICTNALAIGQWYHAMLKVFDQGDDGALTDRIELYLNGELVDVADQVNLEFFTGGNLMLVGHSWSSGPRSFDGLLDGVRLVSGTDAVSLIEEIPNAREVLGLPGAGSVEDDHILVLPDRNDTSPVYWMHTDGISQEVRTVPVLR